MWSENVGEMSEFFRSSLPYYIVVLLPILILMSPVTVHPVQGAYDFPVFRMQHFDLQGVKYGSRSSLLSFEAHSIDSKMPARKCIIAKIHDVSLSRVKELIDDGVGAIVAILPDSLDKVTDETREHIMELEQGLLREEINIPVYFTHHSDQVEEVYNSVMQSTQKTTAGSAFQALVGSVSANGYQLVVNAKQAKAIPEAQISNIQGKLGGYSDEQLPTVAIVAHYDSFGIAPDLSFGSDSNGSGVAALMELARLFSRLASNYASSAARFNLVFVATGGGKFNYLGSKKFLEDQLDTADGGLFQDSLYTVCLDSLGQGDELNVHVSKPPKEGSNSAVFYEALKTTAAILYPEVAINMVHKKINLADDMLAWEHERYSIRRLPAMTLSHHKSSKDPRHRGTVLDLPSGVDIHRLARNVHLLAEALGSHLYNTSGPLFRGELGVSEQLLSAWVSHLTAQPRSAPVLSAKGNNPIIPLLDQAMRRYLKDVKVTHLVADKRDPEFVFYDQTLAVLSAFSVKPAIFDLCLTFLIVAYLAVLYFSVQKFHLLYYLIAGSAKAKLK